MYKSWELPERAPRPPPPPRVTQPFNATSAYQENYPAHEPQPRWKRQPDTWKGRISCQHPPVLLNELLAMATRHHTWLRPLSIPGCLYTISASLLSQ